MPPTIQTALSTDKRPVRPGERRSELVCRVKYCNTLPDIPFDPKFITYPFDSTRFIQYKATSLERNYKYEVLTEHDLGVTIDLINKDAYTNEYGAQLDPADEKLLEEDVLTPQDSKRSRHHARSVSWLRRTEYISTEQTRFQPQNIDKVEAKVGHGIKNKLKDETVFLDRDSQIKAIEKTFEDAKKPIEKHYSKPNVVPVEIFPVYPDFKIWKYPCAQVIFDSDPAPAGRSVPAQIEEMSQAMIRGVMDESGEQFVAYFLPTEETLEKRHRDFSNSIEYEDDEEYEYKMAREYNWNVKSKATKGYEENYFLVMRQDGVYYNELETRVRLSKRRQKVGQQPNNTRLVVRHRPLNAQEYRMQRYRERLLEAPGEEEDEEEEEQEQEQEQESQQQDGDEDEEEEEKKDDDEEGEGEREEGDQEEAEGDGETAAEAETDERENKSGDEEEEEEDRRSGDEDEEKRSGDEDEKQSGSEKAESDQEQRNESEASEKEKSDSEGGGSGSEEEEQARSKSSGSRSSSPASNKSRSPSRSPSAARSKSRSRSRSKSKSKSRSRSASRSKSRSRSRSASPEKSAASGSASSSGSGSSSGSESDSDDGEK
ncbi:RNA polymerase II-associated factor 1 homolog [Anabrus simplex]|uniref:RNA polymerase II-associated factor 1 homolog n=1 Tax=Anabrus simplex TaxID=316456 RepID=UPI0034DD8984